MKKILFSLFAAAMSLAVQSETIVPAGDVSGTWTLTGSPYLVMGMTTVPNGSTLTIEPGVEVEWQGSFTMWVAGRILAQGTETDTILFTAADPIVGFRSIRYVNTDPANDTSRFEYCIFEYGNVYGPNPDNSGGAFALLGFGKVIFDHCLFRYNKALDPQPLPDNPCGGAIALSDCSPVITNCTFLNNEAYSGGAILCYIDSHPLIENNTFLGNIAQGYDWGQGYGGAISCYIGCDPSIKNNIFSGNTGDNGGGGIAMVDHCDPVIERNLFYQNDAGWGGAIEVQDASRPLIINNTMANNHASSWGGGIHLWTDCNVEIWNTIVWENTPTQIHLQENTDTISAYYSDVMGGPDGVAGEGFIDRWLESMDSDPLFEESDSCYYCLTEASPCIDAANPFCTDPDGTTCDIGACWCNYLHVGTPEFQVPSANWRTGFRVDIYPNPADRIVNCQLSIVDCKSVSLRLFDLFGREVRTHLVEMKSGGEGALRLDVSDLPAGIYLFCVQADGQGAVRKLVVR